MLRYKICLPVVDTDIYDFSLSPNSPKLLNEIWYKVSGAEKNGKNTNDTLLLSLLLNSSNLLNEI